MSAYHNCNDTSDLVALFLPQQLYLKPLARLNISLQLPNVKKLGRSVSHWEIMDNIRSLIKPDEFSLLKVTKTTVEFVRFEAELDNLSKLNRALNKLDNKMIKLKDFSNLMRLRAAKWKSDYPSSQAWDDYFQNAKDMNEMKAGNRPDTVHITNLPSKWFSDHHYSSEVDVEPSEKIFHRVFDKFGAIRFVDIPICDPYRKKMKDHISGFKTTTHENTEFFEGYVQFKDYIGFFESDGSFARHETRAPRQRRATEVYIKVDFDRTKHLSDASIRRREIVREKLVREAKDREDKEKAKKEEEKRMEEVERRKQVDMKTQKEMRRKLREEKRKVKILEKLEINGTDEINEKIAAEEKKLVKVQRKLEAIRLLEELFRRIKEKNVNNDNIQRYDNTPNPSYNELKRYKDSSELEVLTQREKLHYALKGRVMLKNLLAEEKLKKMPSLSSSDSELSLDEPVANRNLKPAIVGNYPIYEPPWPGIQYPPFHSGFPGPMFPDYMGRVPGMNMGEMMHRKAYPLYMDNAGPLKFNRRRGGYRGRFQRGGKNQFVPDMEMKYKRFFNKPNYQKNGPRNVRSSSRSRKWSHSHYESGSPSDRSRSRSHSPRSRKRYSRSGSRDRKKRSRSRSSRSRSRDYSRSRSRSRKRSKRRSHSRSSRRSRSREKSRGRSRSRERTREKSKERSREKSKEKSREKSKEKSREKSVRKSREKSRSREGSVQKVLGKRTRKGHES